MRYQVSSGLTKCKEAVGGKGFANFLLLTAIYLLPASAKADLAFSTGPAKPQPGSSAGNGCVYTNRGDIACPSNGFSYRNGSSTQSNQIATPPAPPASMFDRDWRLYIPGAAYQTENVIDGTRTLHTSTGANLPNNSINISANGTYRWKADGKVIQGRWVLGDREYPVVLQNAYGGKNWKAVSGNGEILLWDGQSLASQFKGR